MFEIDLIFEPPIREAPQDDQRPAECSSVFNNLGLQPLVETRFIPRQYEPNYAYPLLVLLHARGGDEDQLVRAMPALSWRNYVGLGLRGPEPVIKRDRPCRVRLGPRVRLAGSIRAETETHAVRGRDRAQGRL